VTIYDAMIRILAEALALGNGVVSHWVSVPANASGPLDPNITLTQTGTDLVNYIASWSVHSSDILCVILDALF